MNKKLFYLLSFTWGLILSIIGCLVFIVLRPFLGKPVKYDNCYYFEIGNNWGGLELGWLFLVNKNPSTHVRNHELGHGYQNCLYGPFFIILWILGIIRYHVRNIIKCIYPGIVLKPYDSIWFEGQATEIGNKIMSIDN